MISLILKSNWIQKFRRKLFFNNFFNLEILWLFLLLFKVQYVMNYFSEDFIKFIFNDIFQIHQTNITIYY